MSDVKIFSEIKGIFSWLEKVNSEEETKQQSNYHRKPSKYSKKDKPEQKQDIIQEEEDDDNYENDATNQEERMKNTKQQIKEFLKFLDIDAEQEEIEALNELANPEGRDSKLQFEKFYKVFVKDEETAQKESQELKSAFKNLTEDKSDKCISLERLDKVMQLYDKKYNGEMINRIKSEIESSKANRDGQFFYDEYINEQFFD